MFVLLAQLGQYDISTGLVLDKTDQRCSHGKLASSHWSNAIECDKNPLDSYI